MHFFKQSVRIGTLLLANLLPQAVATPVGQNYTGIWQDEQIPPHYYTIHHNQVTNAVVFVDMTAIESTQDSFQSAYYGTFTQIDPAGVSIPTDFKTDTADLSSLKDSKRVIRLQFQPENDSNRGNVWMPYMCGRPRCLQMLTFKKVF